MINAVRGHFAEFGMVVSQGARNVHLLITIILEEDNDDLSVSARSALLPLATALLDLDTQISKLSKAILIAHRRSEVSVRLATIPGIGPIVASSLFKCGREFAAYLGLVPRQHSTGGKSRLGRITKMGNRHLRKLLVVGAHAALYSIKSGKTNTPLAIWARSLLAKKPFKLVAVALANKMARIAWVVMAQETTYNPMFKEASSQRT